MKSGLEKLNLTPKTLEEATETISFLAKIVVELREENLRLKEQLNTNSKNSSLPSSKDIKKPKSTKKPSGRNRGGQKGHKGNQRTLVELSKVSRVITCPPMEHCHCGGKVRLKKKITRHQIFEIPVVDYEIIEYQLQHGCCMNCSTNFRGTLPSGVNQKGYGPRVQAMTALLTSKYRLSKRLVQSWFSDVFGMPICLGSVSNIEHTVSQSLRQTYGEILTQVRSEAVIHLDETGYKERNKSGWAWVMSSLNHTYFALNHSRGRKVAKELIGSHHGHIYVTDRYSAYDYLPEKNRQICWAHLKRDFQKISERHGESGKIGKGLLKCYEKIFKFYKTEYESTPSAFTRKQKKRLRYFKNKLLKWLRRGMFCKHKMTARTCKNIWESDASLWQFFEFKNVPPTNNHAERQIRPLVISKKLTFGTQSDRGSRFIERIFSVIATCKQQKKEVLFFLTEAIKNFASTTMKRAEA